MVWINKTMSKKHPAQLPLFFSPLDRPFSNPFPSTRYQGSKRSLIEWIWEHTAPIDFDSVLDVFGGTAVVSHMFKSAGKKVIYNDSLRFNQKIAQALIENNSETLPQTALEALFASSDVQSGTFIQETFKDIYFTDAENRWLDQVTTALDLASLTVHQAAIAWYALFQACIAKRPYNLFHRANLYMRTAEIERSFGNKTTWDTPFEQHMRHFVQEANAAVFDNGQKHHALCLEALQTPRGADLVYLDPPYLSEKGIGVNYRDFYHFLEGILLGEAWGRAIDYRSKHRRLIPQKNRVGLASYHPKRLRENHRPSSR